MDDSKGIKPNETGMYLKLFHGRDDPEEDMDDWGYEGPTIGPLVWAHTTYNSHFRVRLVHPVQWEELGFPTYNEEPDFEFKDDMIVFNGCYYGDWSLYFHEEKTNG